MWHENASRLGAVFGAAAAGVMLATSAVAQTVYIGPTHTPGAPRAVSPSEIAAVVGGPAVAVAYPREWAPLVGTVPLERSVAVGVDHATPMIHSGDTVVSVSQGAVVAELTRRRLADQGVTDVRWVSYGDPSNVDGGLLTKLPKIPTMPRVVEAPCGCDRVTYALEYDIVADAPDRPNPLSWANAVMGGIYEHSTYTADLVAEAQVAGTAVSTVDAGGTHVLLKQSNLPLTRPLRQLGVSPVVVDGLDRVLRPAVDAGYDRGPASSAGHQSAGPRGSHLPRHRSHARAVGHSGR